MHRMMNLETGEWPEFAELSVQSSVFFAPVIKALKNINEMKKIDWHTDEEILCCGNKYKKFMELKAVIDGRNRTAWIWSLMDVQCPVDVIVEDNDVIGFVYTNMQGCSVLVKPGLEKLTPLTLWDDPMLSKADHLVKHYGTFYVPMRDGTKLATDVWVPGDLPEGAKIPAVLMRTPYGRFNYAEGKKYFVQRGYALVSQDVRGRDDSEGEWIPNHFEIEDGDDTLNWIAAQTWSDGQVGMIGPSYLGKVQWMAAASGNPHLKALVSQVTAGSPFVDIPRPGGVMLSGFLAWSFMMADKKTNPDALSRVDWNEILSIRPIKDIPQKALGRELGFWTKWMEHPNNDDFWKREDWALHGDKIDVPALLVSGWFDDDGRGTTQAWDMNKQHKRVNQKMVLGPWMHHFNTTRTIHNIEFGSNAIRYDLDVLYVRWYDHFLKGVDNGVEKEPKVSYYMVGENQWKTDENWPPEGSEYKKLYIQSKGNARTSMGGGYLSTTPPSDQPADTYKFDPLDPAPHLIDVSENEMAVPENYKDVEKREDILVYTSEPLKEDLTVVGDIYAEIYAASSAKDTDWVVRLTDVDESGNSIRLSDEILRARYRNSFEKPELLKPGKIEKYTIRMPKIANVFKKGHRIRVQITSGAKNLCFPNHNTGNDHATDVEMITAYQTVYHDQNYRSHIKLPVLKGSF